MAMPRTRRSWARWQLTMRFQAHVVWHHPQSWNRRRDHTMDFSSNGYTIRLIIIRADSGTSCRRHWAVHPGSADATEAVHSDLTDWIPTRGPAEREAKAQAIYWAGDLPHAATLTA